MNTIRAVILAGGKGHRLDKFGTPKPLVRVGRRALISRIVGMLQTAEVQDISVLVSHEDNLVGSFIIKKFGVTNGVKIIKSKKSVSSELGAFLSIEHDKELDLLVTACDIVFEKNPFRKLIKHKVKRGDIRALVSKSSTYNTASGAHVKFLCTKDTVISVGPELKHYDGMLVGAYLFSKDAWLNFKKVGTQHSKKYTDTIFNIVAKDGHLRACNLGNNEWYDINTPEVLIRAELLEHKAAERRYVLPVIRKDTKLTDISPTAYFYNKKKIRTDIIIESGLLSNISSKSILPKGYEKSPHFIITDKRVDMLYGKKLHNDLKKQGWIVDKIVIEEGEGVKAIETFVALAQILLEKGIDKQSLIISLGGGVVNNIAGFLASTLYRGIGLIHIPTTLLAQNDAAIGIKQGVNGPKGKNLLGVKYSPMRIIVDPKTLLTLSDRQIRDGLNECIKHALAQDKKFYSYLLNYSGSIRDIAFFEKIIKKNIELKIELMENDFDEEKEALALLYGHEVGHAIEYLSGFQFGHGEAIAIGMRVSSEIALLLGVAKEKTLEAHKDIFKKYKIRATIPKTILRESIMNMLKYDKKFHGGDVYFSLVSTVGKLWNVKGEYLIPVNEAIILKAIERSYS